MRGVASEFVSEDRLISRFTRYIYNIYGPQFDTAELDYVSVGILRDNKIK
jgi:hypothetical protein